MKTMQKSFVRAANIKAGSTGKSSMGGVEAHAKRLDKTSFFDASEQLTLLHGQKSALVSAKVVATSGTPSNGTKRKPARLSGGARRLHCTCW